MKRCTCLGGFGDGKPGCPTCLGHGLLWGDGAPMTRCPGGGAKPLVNDPTRLPCGRHGETCPGCDRRREDIPTDEDRTRTLEHHRRRAASAG